ncbi:glycerophosphodiester phosphodiesterase [Luteolibacter luteus]|uniref:Glycerophosphodiester phosphodiesterase n=1 Tax=Luteolibacter luteus TaxID=2728835 RepID=A0A858RQX1_9BACT|nr:glycerophosphodiester phosphodiesterase [Luteolibacter luteus]QJE98934.1 glycerophosphodiester phosphodiesterase [Luteolibacter luteus]
MRILFAVFASTTVATLSAADLPKLVAHRGASHAAPENTLSAFKLAWQEGADGIEGDFHLSSDGKVVCIHDFDTKRVAGEKLVIAQTSWEQLSKLDVGSWKDARYKGEPIPLLTDVLDVLPAGKKFFLEIKAGVEIVEPIRKILEEKKADPAQVTIISFNDDVIRECREKMPQFPAHWISDLKEINKEGKESYYLERFEATKGQGLQFQATSPVTAQWLAPLKEKHIPLTSWTVDDPEIARKMISYGVSNITTNRPGPLRAELSK